MPDHETKEVRLDKWLWAARFFKTRSSASQAVIGGRVHVNGASAKPARAVRVGDQLRIHRNEEEFLVEVLAVSGHRGPASEARTLYQEGEESVLARERAREQRRLESAEQAGPRHRPGKRDRRLIRDFIRKTGG